MKQRPRIYYTESQKVLMWERWRKGESLQQIARLFDRNHSSIQRILAETGGIRPAPRHRSSLALTLAEREEISRALASGRSIRSIAALLERAPSTISREIQRNGGQGCYRASLADQDAWDRARRPKTCKLAENRTLARIVAAKLQWLWSPEQIAGWLKCAYPDDESYQALHSSPRRFEEGVTAASKAHASHAPFAPSHAKDRRSRQNQGYGVDQRASGYRGRSCGARTLGRRSSVRNQQQPNSDSG